MHMVITSYPHKTAHMHTRTHTHTHTHMYRRWQHCLSSPLSFLSPDQRRQPWMCCKRQPFAAAQFEESRCKWGFLELVRVRQERGEESVEQKCKCCHHSAGTCTQTFQQQTYSTADYTKLMTLNSRETHTHSVFLKQTSGTYFIHNPVEAFIFVQFTDKVIQCKNVPTWQVHVAKGMTKHFSTLLIEKERRWKQA